MEHELKRPPATPEEIWAILNSVSERLDKMAAETDRRQAESEQRQKEAEQWQAKADQWKAEAEQRQKELDRQMKDTDRRLKKTDALFNSQWGKLMESLVEGDLIPLLKARDIEVKSTHPRVSGRLNGEHYEFDILAMNDEKVVVVEVKTTLRSEDVTHFLGKLARFTEYQPKWKDSKIYGAVAYLQSDSMVWTYAERQGLFVIRATGSSASIINEADFQPKVFC